ncbi:MAG TPA: hypothetical protein VGO40_22420 [Longimicrobium sp.]|jgi:hypothetical protein|nr:hypothetical protein [Longimicrobium sp.]
MNETFDWHGWQLRTDSLYFEAGGDEVLLSPTDLLLAIDETGIEDLSDPKYPLFGLGGCGVLAGQYLDLIERPWTRLKEKHFGSMFVPLHAAELLGATPQQLAALGEFFRRNQFFRLAALTTDKTEMHPSIHPYPSVAMVLMRQLAEISEIVPFRRVAVVLESSQRTDGLAWNTFKDFQMWRTDGSAREEVDVIFLRGSKRLRYSALEVADFVMHAAGTAVREERLGKRMLDRKDFAAVFGSVPEHLVHFLCLRSFGFCSRTS